MFPWNLTVIFVCFVQIDNGMMTPTMKIRRDKVTDKYRREIEALFNWDAERVRTHQSFLFRLQDVHTDTCKLQCVHVYVRTCVRSEDTNPDWLGWNWKRWYGGAAGGRTPWDLLLDSDVRRLHEQNDMCSTIASFNKRFTEPGKYSRIHKNHHRYHAIGKNTMLLLSYRYLKPSLQFS